MLVKDQGRLDVQRTINEWKYTSCGDAGVNKMLKYEIDKYLIRTGNTYKSTHVDS